MRTEASTIWQPAKPNQQLIIQTRGAASRASRRERQHQELVALGQQVRTALAGMPIPLLAVQTHFSVLEGTVPPRSWSTVLGVLFGDEEAVPADRRGGNHPSDAGAVVRAEQALRIVRERGLQPPAPTAPPPAMPDRRKIPGPWAVLCDRNDLCGLPAVLEHWAHGRVGVGCCIDLDSEVVLLVPTEDAYRRLCQLLSQRHDGATTRQILEGSAFSDLIALVHDAEAGRRLQRAGAEVWWRAGLHPETRSVPFPVACVPLLPHLAGDRDAGAALEAMRRRGTIDPRWHGGDAFSDLIRLAKHYRGYEDQMAAGAALRERCRFAPESSASGTAVLHLPPLPPELRGRNPDQELRRLAEAGISDRYGPGPHPAVHARLEHELAVITAKRFASYILTVWSIARERRTCGRGSAASSLVVYLLRITNVDPLRYNLMFERFMAPERADPPDIDVDFAWDERDELLADVLDHFGSAHVAMVATHLHLHTDGAIREAARTHGLADAEISAVQARLHDFFHYGVSRDGDRDTGLPEPWPRILETALTLIGAPHHFGVHCGGVVITEDPLRTIVPVHSAAKQVPGPEGQREAMRAMPTIAWEKDGAEALGLVKIDLLGNRSLAVVRDCLRDLAEDGHPIDERIWNPASDPSTREMLATGRTLGCFYIESPAMRQLQAKVGSGDFDRLIVHSSIIRPASGGFITTYIARHHRWMGCKGQITDAERIHWFPHPVLEQLLSESYGILSYQEDVMQVAQAMAGFGSGEANQLRKALGRSDTGERLQVLVSRFDAGCRKNGVAPATIDLVWQMISSFAGYSFAKAHSASYAIVSFQCAFLKAHHPAIFMARVIANEGGFYRTVAYVEEARRLGVAIHGPCILCSEWKTGWEKTLRTSGLGAIRLGFQVVKDLSRRTAAAIEEQRRLRPFRGIRDLVQRTGCASDELIALLEAGALDAVTPESSPAQRAWIVAIVSHQAAGQRKAHAGQQRLEMSADDQDPRPPLLPPLSPALLDRRQFARIGVLPRAHPLCLWPLEKRPALRARDLLPRMIDQRIALVAWPIARKDVEATYLKDDQGQALPEPRFETMAFVTLEDETGLVETTWFPDCYRRHAVLLERQEPLLIHGVVDVEFGNVTVRVEHARS